MLEYFLELLVVPILVGASVGSCYFVATHVASYTSRWVLTVMVVTTWLMGFSLGWPISHSPFALFVSLVSSAVGVVILDSLVVSIREGKEAPPILNWIVDLVRSLRSGK